MCGLLCRDNNRPPCYSQVSGSAMSEARSILGSLAGPSNGPGGPLPRRPGPAQPGRAPRRHFLSVAPRRAVAGGHDGCAGPLSSGSWSGDGVPARLGRSVLPWFAAAASSEASVVTAPAERSRRAEPAWACSAGPGLRRPELVPQARLRAAGAAGLTSCGGLGTCASQARLFLQMGEGRRVASPSHTVVPTLLGKCHERSSKRGHLDVT